MAETIEDKILNKIKKCGRGSVFFIPDFVSYGNRNAVNKALERLTDKGMVLRAARGIYCYPKIEKVYGLGPIPPSMEDIAEAMAKRDGAKIVPSGFYAFWPFWSLSSAFQTQPSPPNDALILQNFPYFSD